MSQNKANDAAKLRIRKESDFNITEFFRIICVFLVITLAVSTEIFIFAEEMQNHFNQN